MTEFKCKRCGKCCGIVPFTKSEYKAIKNIAKKRHIGFVKQEMYGKIVYLPKKLVKELNDIYETKDINKVENLKCPFLEYDAMGKATCIIYENRPEVCRLFGNGNHPCLKCPNYKIDRNRLLKGLQQLEDSKIPLTVVNKKDDKYFGKGIKILNLVLKYEWFDKIYSGEKTHEYRLANKYWQSRKIWNYDIVKFQKGYNKNPDYMIFKIKSISTINGLDTDLKINQEVYDIELGEKVYERISTKQNESVKE